jgi:glucokinase
VDSFLGIEIGGTKLQIVTGDGAGRIHARQRFSVDPAAGGAGIRKQLEAGLRELLQTSKPLAIGVGFGGPVDWSTGNICCSHQVEGWSEFPLGQWLGELTKLPVVVDNDANVAALGEALHGAAAGYDSVFYVTLGSGVGGGLVVSGRIYHGAKPGESEIGHVRLDRSGTIVEEHCSGWAVDRKIREAIKSNPATALAQMVGGATSGEAKFLHPALERGDAVAQRILNETAEDLAFGLSHVVQLFHPEIIVVGGGLALVGEPLRVAIAVALPRFVMDSFSPGPQIALASLREDAVPFGALALAARSLS